MKKTCKNCWNIVDCGNRDPSCRGHSGKHQHFGWTAKPVTVVERYQKWLKTVAHADWDKYTVAQMAFEAGFAAGKESVER